MCHLEGLFQIAYGRDGLNANAWETLLYGQLQDGLKYELIQSSAVSGAQSYQEISDLLEKPLKSMSWIVKQPTWRLSLQK